VDPTLIAVAQLAITVAEPDANRRAAADAIAEAAAAGARLVVLPELCDSGYVFDAADPAAEARGLAAPAADSTTLRQWHELAARHRLVIVGGFCELGADGRLYNSAALVDASGTRAVYRKAHLWDSEKLVFTPGDAALPKPLNGRLVQTDVENARVPADQFFPPVPQTDARLVVDVEDGQLIVMQNERVRRIVYEGAESRLARAQLGR